MNVAIAICLLAVTQNQVTETTETPTVLERTFYQQLLHPKVKLLLRYDDVRTELKMSISKHMEFRGQVNRRTAAAAKLYKAFTNDGEMQEKVILSYKADTLRYLKFALEQPQTQRLEEIYLWSLGPAGPTKEEFPRLLDLSPEQVQSIIRLGEECVQTINALYDPRDFDPNNRSEIGTLRKRATQMIERADKAVLQVLNPDQRRQWTEKRGERFLVIEEIK